MFSGVGCLLLKSVIKEIDKRCRVLLWTGESERKRGSAVAWNKVCRRKNEGGIGIKDLEAWNKAIVVN